jgi:hypothetical protein
MEKQKLAELVMEKMRRKKEEEERSRPHYEMLRLEVVFEKEIQDMLKLEVAGLEQLLAGEKKTLVELEAHLQVVWLLDRNWTTLARAAIRAS